MAAITQESPRVGISSSNSDADEELSYLPGKLKERLLPFQKKGIIFALERSGRCMIADEMGLGKTIQAIAVSYYYKNEWPLLIVVPSSLRYPWVDEMEKWIPELRPEDIIVIQNKTDIWQIPKSKVTVLGYGLLTSDAHVLTETLRKQKFKVVIIDESHYMKSRNATRSKILLPIVQNAIRAILLTGTPALGRPEELFMQLEALCPQKFGTWTEYAKKYCNAHVRYFGKRQQWDCRGASNLDELHELLSNVMIRRMKSEVLTQLPPKIRQRIPFDLPKTIVKELNTSFEEWEKLMRASNLDSSKDDFFPVMSLITRMFKQTAIAKAGAVKDYIKMLLENEELKFLVFAHHLRMLQACTEAVIESKVRYIRIDGSVPSAERINLVNQFQKDPATRVAILSIQAAGQGLTFTAATHVVFAELYWDPGHIKQAEDRAHRIGQSNSVNIHYLIANGTLDSVMWAMLNRKATVTGATLNGKKEKLQAPEGDKDKWNFLNFAEVWTPSEGLNESKDEVLFTHFEKEKQHDIRDFFSPKPDIEKKRKMDSSCNASPCLGSNSSQASEEKDLESGRNTEPHDPEDLDELCREAKRPRSVDPSTPKIVPNRGKRKCLFSERDSSFSEEDFQEEDCVLLPGSTKGFASEVTWLCSLCTYSNNSLLPYCEMCESPRRKKIIQKESQIGFLSTESEDGNAIKNNIGLNDIEMIKEETNKKSDCCKQELKEEYLNDSESTLTYLSLLFCASRNTDRIHAYTKAGEPLNCNFIPLDIKVGNWEDLPACFQQKQNHTLILRFVREWDSLTAMKQRIIRKSGQLFSNPVLAAEEILSKQQAKLTSTKRYMTKEDIARASLTKADSSGGSVRIITKTSREVKRVQGTPVGKEDNHFIQLPSEDGSCPDTNLVSDQIVAVEEFSSSKGYLQAVDNEGNPLCLRCQKPTIQVEAKLTHTAWDTRFCSLKCQEDFFFYTNNSYLRTKVFEIEHGVCQLCGLNAQELYLCVRDAPKSQRKDLLEKSWMSKLPLKQLNEIILNPAEGHFWQVDHIKPVFSGGGQCTLENFQTLCTVCHKERTAKQAKERSQVKKQCVASKYASDITKFFVKL
ncbi:DNA annealing helicase and endonuclease ZRANB3 isoform X1 [Crotalus tigris]|uniref:DNA annealing helicase and endonuclease ZRANB3 isoform X1 n=2 Tax=Crotalus tigris TaxID=88082 RepID=UPI00192F851D|nr:DNA annealing helicase and endonuclease ZRANB3 isoform X1 [Crotalus tigris]